MSYNIIKIKNEDLPIRFIISNDWSEMLQLGRCGVANGYVAVNKKYSCWGNDYYDKVFDNIDIHGGLTFSAKLSKCPEHIKKAYLEQPNTSADDDVWIYGFDTLHAGDTASNRNEEAVIAEVKYLQKQMLQFYIPTQEDIVED